MATDQSTTGDSRTIGLFVFTEGPDTLSYRYERWAMWCMLAFDAMWIVIGLVATPFAVGAILILVAPGWLDAEPNPIRFQSFDQRLLAGGAFTLLSLPWVGIAAWRLWLLSRPSSYPGWADHVFDRRSGHFRRGSRIACELADVRGIWVDPDRESPGSCQILVKLERGMRQLSLAAPSMSRPDAEAGARWIGDFLGVPVSERFSPRLKPNKAGVAPFTTRASSESE